MSEANNPSPESVNHLPDSTYVPSAAPAKDSLEKDNLSEPYNSEGLASKELDKLADRMAQNKGMQTLGNMVMPGFAAHWQKLLAAMDSEAAADKEMLATAAVAWHENGELEEADVNLESVRKVEAGFNDELFLDIARETFNRVHASRTSENHSHSDSMLTPELETVLENSIHEDVVAHRRHIYAGLEIMHAEIIAANVASDGKEQITVRFNLDGEEFDRDLQTTQVVNGDETERQWQEDWVFERDPTVDTSVTDKAHTLSFNDAWMFAHRGWVVTSINKAPVPNP